MPQSLNIRIKKCLERLNFDTLKLPYIIKLSLAEIMMLSFIPLELLYIVKKRKGWHKHGFHAEWETNGYQDECSYPEEEEE